MCRSLFVPVRNQEGYLDYMLQQTWPIEKYNVHILGLDGLDPAKYGQVEPGALLTTEECSPAINLDLMALEVPEYMRLSVRLLVRESQEREVYPDLRMHRGFALVGLEEPILQLVLLLAIFPEMYKVEHILEKSAERIFPKNSSADLTYIMIHTYLYSLADAQRRFLKLADIGINKGIVMYVP